VALKVQGEEKCLVATNPLCAVNFVYELFNGLADPSTNLTIILKQSLLTMIHKNPQALAADQPNPIYT